MPVIKDGTAGRRDLATRSADSSGSTFRPLIPSEHDDGIRPLVRHEQPTPGRIQAEVAWPVAGRGDHLIERGSTACRHREHRDAVVTAVRHVQRATRWCDVDVGRIVRSGPAGGECGSSFQRRQCAALGIEAQRGQGGIGLGLRTRMAAWTERDVATSARAASPAAVDALQRFDAPKSSRYTKTRRHRGLPRAQSG